MKIALLAAAFLAVVTPTFATGTKPPPPTSALSSSSASSSSSSAAAALAGAQAGVTSSTDVDINLAPTLTATNTLNASPTAHGGAGGDGGDADVTITAPRQAPSLAQGSLVPSGCGAGVNGGGSGTHGAGFLGLAWTTDECYLFMLGEKFAAIGMPDTACDIWLQTKAAQRAFKGKVVPSCTIGRPTPAPTEVTLKMMGPPLQVNLPMVPIEEAPPPPKAAECTPPPPPKRAASRTPRKPAPPVVTCTQ